MTNSNSDELALNENFEGYLEDDIIDNMLHPVREWVSDHEEFAYTYFRLVNNKVSSKIGAQTRQLLKGYAKLYEDLFVWCPFREGSIVLERPKEINMNNGRLHCDNGPALIWVNGDKEWALNGVSVSQVLVETPFSELNAKELLRTDNVEERREIIRKIGIERVCRDLEATVVDECGNYELLLLDIGDNRQRPYLKMKNPSIGTYHIEGVHPEYGTVEQALNWRNGTKEVPVKLT